MIEAITLHVALPPTALAAVPALPIAPPPPAVGAAEQARFQAAMQVRPEPAAPAATALASERIATPGDRILQGMEHLRGRYRAMGAALDTLTQRSDLTAMDLIAMQMQVAQVTLGVQLIGQVASKLEQNFNSLLKAQ